MPAILGQAQRFTLDTVLSPYVYTFLAAYILSFIFTPIMRRVAEYYGIIDKPDLLRKMHSRPVAYLGGVAVFIGWVGGLAVSQFVGLHYWDASWNNTDYAHHVVIPPAIMIAAFIIITLGLWDDIKTLNPRLKIMGQVAAAVILIVGHVGTHSMGPLLAPINTRLQLNFHFQLSPAFVTVASCILTICLVVFCCNATNLMDGLDGLCGGVTAIIAAGFLFLAVHMAIEAGTADVAGSALRIVLALALLGAVLGVCAVQLQSRVDFHGRYREHVPGVCLRYDDHSGWPSDTRSGFWRRWSCSRCRFWIRHWRSRR